MSGTEINSVNHNKKWSSKDEKYLNNVINSNNIITSQLITELSKKLKRTDYAIKVRVMRKNVIPFYDYVNNENDDLYEKYICYGDKNCIDRLVYLDKWSKENEMVLRDFVNNNDIITYEMVAEIANKIKLNHYAVKIRLMKKYVIPRYDYVNHDNDSLYNKYVCYGKESIDSLAYYNYKKKG
jgi:RNA-binding protein YhbY